MRKLYLKRTGQPPLSFDGTMLAKATSEVPEDEQSASMRKLLARWHEATVYETSQGLYVLHLGFRSLWRGEVDHWDALPFASLSELAAFLSSYEPNCRTIGVPEGVEHSAKKNKAIRQNLEGRWQMLVSDLLAYLPEVAQPLN